jgi:hypothetical protein
MTEEKASRETNRGPGRESGNSDSSRSRKGRRRYFQTKKDGRSQSSGNQPGGQASGQSGQSNQASQSGQSQRGQENNRRGDGKRGEEAPRQRKARRRARSRQRYDDGRRSDAASLEAEVAYTAPQSVYIYEHSAHPELRDSYEFRPDHFSKVGRTLDDYQIDLSKLFPGDIADDGTPVLTNMLPKPQFDWSEWEDARSPDTNPAANPAAGEAASPETRPADEQKG